MSRTQAKLALDCQCDLGEGPTWHENALWFVNINAGELHRFDPVTGVHEFKPAAQHFGGLLGAAVPCTDGHWLLVLKDGFALFEWPEGRVEPIAQLDNPALNNRFNDAKADPTGRVWAGTMDMNIAPDLAALYRLDHDHTITTQVEKISLSNGLAWSSDAKKMYYIDTLTGRVDVFDFDGDAPAPHAPAINRRTLHEFGKFDGSPDGMTIDADDNLWVALWGGSKLVHLDGNTGEQLGEIGLPASQVTSCAFGGPDHKDLYITTARGGLTGQQSLEQPHAGGLFVATPDVGGRPADLFGNPADR
ncbi:MAG: sugar lactone lactonase YvrE [Phycisphaerales bacterium]|jgi:sugar lactone lactonase YvrE